jgi:hypothetical protein
MTERLLLEDAKAFLVENPIEDAEGEILLADCPEIELRLSPRNRMEGLALLAHHSFVSRPALSFGQRTRKIFA